MKLFFNQTQASLVQRRFWLKCAPKYEYIQPPRILHTNEASCSMHAVLTRYLRLPIYKELSMR